MTNLVDWPDIRRDSTSWARRDCVDSLAARGVHDTRAAGRGAQIAGAQCRRQQPRRDAPQSCHCR